MDEEKWMSTVEGITRTHAEAMACVCVCEWEEALPCVADAVCVTLQVNFSTRGFRELFRCPAAHARDRNCHASLSVIAPLQTAID